MIQAVLDNITAFSNVLLTTFIFFFHAINMEMEAVWKVAIVYIILLLFFIGFIMYLKHNSKVNLLYILVIHIMLAALLLFTMDKEQAIPLITTIYIVMGTSVCAYRIIERMIPKKKVQKNPGFYLAIKMFIVFIVMNIFAAVALYLGSIISLITVTLPLFSVHIMNYVGNKK